MEKRSLHRLKSLDLCPHFLSACSVNGYVRRSSILGLLVATSFCRGYRYAGCYRAYYSHGLILTLCFFETRTSNEAAKSTEHTQISRVPTTTRAAALVDVLR